MEQRLLTRAQGSGVPLSRLRKSVAFDRLLAPLIVVAPDRWVLKGALALEYRLGAQVRATKDADLMRYDDESAATADFLAAQTLELEDHFALSIAVGIDPALDAGHAIAAAFLNPVLSGRELGMWEPETTRWAAS